MKYIQSKTKIQEGEIRAKELNVYLEKLKVPKRVWLSEDATGIIPGVKYDSKSNQLIGLTLPLDETTGCPNIGTYIATDKNTMKNHLENSEKSNHVYLVMAQPLKEDVPAYVLMVFGTDNRFQSIDVINRWNHIESELSK